MKQFVLILILFQLNLNKNSDQEIAKILKQL